MPDTMPTVTEGRWISDAARQRAAEVSASAAAGAPPTWKKGGKKMMLLEHTGTTRAMIRKTGNVWEARVMGWEWPVDRQRGNDTGFYPIETFWNAEAAAMACNRVIQSAARGRV